MRSRFVTILGLVCGALFFLLVGLLVSTLLVFPDTKKLPEPKDGPLPPGTRVSRAEVPNLPPPPEKVANPDRIRQNLQPGKTYKTHIEGALNVRGTDKAWGVEEVITINYAFEADIDRHIEQNDGTTIVELRYFRNLRSLKLETRLEDVRIDLGVAGGWLDLASRMLHGGGKAVSDHVKMLDGVSLKPVLASLPLVGISPEKIIQLDQRVKVFTSVEQLSGKKVRLTYVDGLGVEKLEVVNGQMTAQERDFHMASVLVSDALIMPDVDIKIGIRWPVEGSAFHNFVDPSLLARTSGQVDLERTPDYIIGQETCRHVKIVEGRLLFSDPDPKVGRIGYFEPSGSLYFSPREQIIVKAQLDGQARFERFSKDHLLFETRMRVEPQLEIKYSCEPVDTK